MGLVSVVVLAMATWIASLPSLRCRPLLFAADYSQGL